MTRLITSETRHITEKLFACRNAISYYYVPGYHMNKDKVAEFDNNMHTVHTEQYNMSIVDNCPTYWKDVIIPDAVLPMKDIILLKAAATIEDYIVIQGTNEDGLLYKAENIVTEPLDFLTCGNGQLTTSRATSLLADDGYDDVLGCNLLLNAVQYTELMTNFDRYGRLNYESVRRVLSGGNIHKTQLPTANGLLLPLKKYTYEFFNINMYTEWNVKRLQEDGDIYRIYASFEVELNMPQMLCRIENI